MESIFEWCESVKELLKEPQKKVILVAGASSSGKTYRCQILNDYLVSSGKRCLMMSLDNYYKGISKTIVQKALADTEFTKIKDKQPQIIELVKSITEKSYFPDKFNDINFTSLQQNLHTLVGSELADKLSNRLKAEYKNMNFDEPFAIDFAAAAENINTLIRPINNSIIYPHYSFLTNERELKQENKLSGSDYDVIIVEGIYALNEGLTKNLNKNNVITTAIHCDLKTMLSRRLNRDIKCGRSSLTPEQTIMCFLNQVMPSYYRYIYSTLQTADVHLNSRLTKEEILYRDYSLQRKFITDMQIYETLQRIGAQKISEEIQTDYFLEEKGMPKDPNIKVRVRQINNKADALIIEVYSNSENKLTRQVEEYKLSEILHGENQDIKKFIQQIALSGFVIDKAVTKNRQVYKLGDNLIKVDRVKDLGTFTEIDGENNALLISKLDLTKPCNEQYYDLTSKLQAQKATQKDELER